jgi:hypothetical protein
VPTSAVLAARRPRADGALAAGIMTWIGAVLLMDAVPGWSTHELIRQLALGAATWAVLVAVLVRQAPLLRVQTLVVLALATLVEYTFSPLLEAYVYRIGTVPLFVPPGHGLVYLAAAALGRAIPLKLRGWAVAGTVVAGGAWAAHGLLLAERRDLLGAVWFGCLLGFLAWGRSRPLYVGAFVLVSYLELLGTALGTWAWASTDPVLHLVTQGNPPSGAAGGYGWFDLYAMLLAPPLLAWWRRRAGGAQPFSSASTSSCSSPLLASASPPNGPSSPSSELNLPPASTTTGTSAAMSCRASSGSQARSTAPSASSMYDQKSP